MLRLRNKDIEAWLCELDDGAWTLERAEIRASLMVLLTDFAVRESGRHDESRFEEQLAVVKRHFQRVVRPFALRNGLTDG